MHISQVCTAEGRVEMGTACRWISSHHFQDTTMPAALMQFLSINTSDFTALLF